MARGLVHPDSWLVLPPEVEELVPELLALIGAAEAEAERIEIERLICRGDEGSWLDYLRTRTEMLAAAVIRGGTSRSASTLASILRDQYRLAPGVTRLADSDQESLALLERLSESSE